MSEKESLQTLIARKGSVWMVPKGAPLLISNVAFEGDQFSQHVSQFAKELRRRRSALREFKTPLEETYEEEIDELRTRMSALEKRMNQTTEPSQSGDFFAVVEDFVLKIKDIEEIGNAYYQCRDKNLDFFLVTKEFSERFLERIAEIEISISRKYPNVSINLEPLCSDEDIPERSHIVLVKK
jgi:hypothetical protein